MLAAGRSIPSAKSPGCPEELVQAICGAKFKGFVSSFTGNTRELPPFSVGAVLSRDMIEKSSKLRRSRHLPQPA
jgi:hypothetical protein